MDQDDLLREVVRTLNAQGIPFMLVGAYASSLYGEPRLTLDLDIVVDLKDDQVKPLFEAFPVGEYCADLNAMRDAVRRSAQFNVIHVPTGCKVDFIVVKKTPFGRQEFSRRRNQPILAGENCYVATPEDVIIGKLRFFRMGGSEKHLRDIAGILRVSGVQVDRCYVEQWAEELGVTEIWQTVLRAVQDSHGDST